MYRVSVLLLLIPAVLLVAACGAGDQSNSNLQGEANVNELPPGFNAKPIEPGANQTPGIPPPREIDPDAQNDGTPVPGIPDSKNLGKPLPKGATPTPGIPDPETIKRQLEQRNTDPGKVNEPTAPSNRNPRDRPKKN